MQEVEVVMQSEDVNSDGHRRNDIDNIYIDIPMATPAPVLESVDRIHSKQPVQKKTGHGSKLGLANSKKRRKKDKPGTKFDTCIFATNCFIIHLP